MTIEELEEKMAELEKLQTEAENAHAKLKVRMAELKALSEELPESPHPRPELNYGEKYYYIEHDGVTFGYFWNDTDLDFGRLAIGNVFLTEKAAKFAAERLKVLAEMREWAGIWDDPWVMIYDGWSPKAISIHAPDITFGELRFATREDAEGCIKAVGKDRLKKYYFGIPEDRGCCTSER